MNFIELYPDVQLELLLSDVELDLSMREADVGLRLRPPTQSDLIQRRLFTVTFSYLRDGLIPKNDTMPPLRCQIWTTIE